MISHNPEKKLSKTFLATSSGDDADEERESENIYFILCCLAHIKLNIFSARRHKTMTMPGWYGKVSKKINTIFSLALGRITSSYYGA